MSAVPTPTVVFRRRSGWEAADMGILLWQRNWLPLVLFLGIPALAVTIFELLTPDNDLFSWGVTLAAWWVKPFLDRLCLQVVSVRFFEPGASARRLFRGLFKVLTKGLAGDLLWRRFSLSRSAWQPLIVLEKLKGKQFRRRKELLTRNGLGFGPALTIICIAFAAVLQAGELVFLYGITDLAYTEADGIIEFISQKNTAVSILSLLNLIIVESLYVCMGFGLYINSRVETEGWDIELLFKKCVDTAAKSPVRLPPHAPSALAAVLPLALLLCFAVPGHAEENPAREQSPQLEQNIFVPAANSPQEQRVLDNVSESPDFGTEKTKWRPRFKQSDDQSPGGKSGRFSFPDIREIMGKALRFVLGMAVAAAACFGALYAYRHRYRLFPGLAGKDRPLQAAPPQEPRQLLEKALQFHSRGKIREAWALCFRAFIAGFALYFSLPAEATEYEALAIVRKSAADDIPVSGFALFVSRWVGFAYGGREPAAGMFEEALDSCRLLISGGQS